ncbi:MAG: GNAT family N-acetyltransferase [Eubacteriales bacterium]|nr:GNAT family N-acetyltransferase [Eubacteriales bacterium]
MSYIYRKAKPEDVRPALDLALDVFMEFDAPDYGPEHTERMRLSIEDRINNFDDYLLDERLMFVALDHIKVVGVIETYGNSYQKNRIGLMFVNSNYQRQGIATELMNLAICELKMSGYDKIALNSSPHGLPFYTHYGFTPVVTEKNINTPWKTPMEYIPKEIWDVLDKDGNKTGRYHERARPMATEDYHLAVHVWKYNGKGKWLLDKRAYRTPDDIGGGKWETTGGAAIAGEDSLTAALRETKEELGIELDPAKGKLFRQFANHVSDEHRCLIDVWVFEHDCAIKELHFQTRETCGAMWATADQIRELIRNNEFFSEARSYFDEMTEDWGKNNG